MISIRSCIERNKHIATCRALSLKRELLPPHHGSQQQRWRWWWSRWIWLRGHFPIPAGCRNRDFLSPESPLRWRWRYRDFCGFLMDALGFLGRRLLIGAGIKVGGRPGGPHHALARPGLARAKGGVATLWPLSDSPSSSVSLPGK